MRQSRAARSVVIVWYDYINYFYHLHMERVDGDVCVIRSIDFCAETIVGQLARLNGAIGHSTYTA